VTTQQHAERVTQGQALLLYILDFFGGWRNGIQHLEVVHDHDLIAGACVTSYACICQQYGKHGWSNSYMFSC